MPTLRELEARFIAYHKETEEEMFARGVAQPADFFKRVETLAEAHGIRFLCPKARAHMIQIYFSGSPVPEHLGKNKDGQTVRWSVFGTSLDDLSLTPSIHEQDDICGWHGFVGSGGVPPGNAA